jgi:hypothetical protein
MDRQDGVGNVAAVQGKRLFEKLGGVDAARRLGHDPILERELLAGDVIADSSLEAARVPGQIRCRVERIGFDRIGSDVPFLIHFDAGPVSFGEARGRGVACREPGHARTELLPVEINDLSPGRVLVAAGVAAAQQMAGDHGMLRELFGGTRLRQTGVGGADRVRPPERRGHDSRKIKPQPHP